MADTPSREAMLLLRRQILADRLADCISLHGTIAVHGGGELGVSVERQDIAEIVAALRLAAKPSDEGSPDDIRAQGWMVAVHNDYRQLGEPHTFWLFTKDGRAVKGEGMSDADALNKVRAALSPGEPKP